MFVEVGSADWSGGFFSEFNVSINETEGNLAIVCMFTMLLFKSIVFLIVCFSEITVCVSIAGRMANLYCQWFITKGSR